MEQRRASVWWVAFFLTISTYLVAGIVSFVLVLLISYALPQGLLEQSVSMILFMLVGFVILGLATWNQAKFTKNRYMIADPNKTVLYATAIFALITILLVFKDLSEGYTPGILEYGSHIVSLAIFYFVSKKYLV